MMTNADAYALRQDWKTPAEYDYWECEKCDSEVVDRGDGVYVCTGDDCDYASYGPW